MCDLREEDLEEEAYDAVYCRDNISHIENKLDIFTKIYVSYLL